MRVRREALWEYLKGAMWLFPMLAVGLALLAGSALSLVNFSPDSVLHILNFQGTPDDARTMLISIMTTMVTVIALVLGLTVVALQLSSTQFSPRVLRNFLRDRHNQVVLSVFVATFAYSTAGLYTVGVSGGARTEEFPRLAVTGALVMTFASLVALVYFTHHLAHSLQIDDIMRVVERGTMAGIRDDLREGAGEPPEHPEADARALPAPESGYVQALHASPLLRAAGGREVHVRFAVRPGDYVVAGTTVAWAWGEGDLARLSLAVEDAVRVGFERTLEQDVALGIRQLVDIASKALSPAINDPYTAVQAVHHITNLLCELARKNLGGYQRHSGQSTVWVPAYTFDDYLALACSQVRRHGSGEPLVDLALLQLLRDCLQISPRHGAAIGEQVRVLMVMAERTVKHPEDLEPVRARAAAVLAAVEAAA